MDRESKRAKALLEYHNKKQKVDLLATIDSSPLESSGLQDFTMNTIEKGKHRPNLL